MKQAETLITVKTESTWNYVGPIKVTVVRLSDGKIEIRASKRITAAEPGKAGSTFKTRVTLPAEKLKDILDRLGRLKIPAAPEFPMGCDGDFTELEIGGYWGRAHYRWWSAPPEGWKPLDDIVREIFSLAGIDTN